MTNYPTGDMCPDDSRSPFYNGPEPCLAETDKGWMLENRELAEDEYIDFLAAEIVADARFNYMYLLPDHAELGNQVMYKAAMGEPLGDEGEKLIEEITEQVAVMLKDGDFILKTKLIFEKEQAE